MSGGPVLPPFPDPLTLPAFQDYVARMVAARGFTQDVDRVFVLWVEELGELAEHLGHAAPAETRDLGGELADVALYISDLANVLSVNLERALGAALPGAGRVPPAGATLSQWQAFAAGSPESSAERTALGLLAAAGETARMLRKRWSGVDGDPARPLAEALVHALRLAQGAGVDLTRAIAEKERKNAGRTWSY